MVAPFPSEHIIFLSQDAFHPHFLCSVYALIPHLAQIESRASDFKLQCKLVYLLLRSRYKLVTPLAALDSIRTDNYLDFVFRCTPEREKEPRTNALCLVGLEMALETNLK
jgi:hypothetical protein